MIRIRGRERMFIGKFGDSEGEFSYGDGEPKVKTGACHDDEVGCDSAVAEMLRRIAEARWRDKGSSN